MYGQKKMIGNQQGKNPEKDCYGTCNKTWDVILQVIPKDKVIWQPFYMDGQCADYLREKGYNVIHENKDFFKYEPDNYDIILDNPPFSNKDLIFDRLHQLNKPFIVFYPFRAFLQKGFRRFDETHNYKIIIPEKRFAFYKDNKITKMPDVSLICHNIDFIDFGQNKFNYEII